MYKEQRKPQKRQYFCCDVYKNVNFFFSSWITFQTADYFKQYATSAIDISDAIWILIASTSVSLVIFNSSI
jgi:hypothetical protein